MTERSHFNSKLGYGSHFPVLAAMVAKTTGPVIEFGMGDWSTAMLHLMCEGRRPLHSVDTDLQWINQYRWMECDSHEILHVPEESIIDYAKNIKGGYSVAFVDNKPGESRKDVISAMKQKANFIVIHDSEKDFGCAADYKYESVIPEFRFKYEFRRYRPYTLVLSDFLPIRLPHNDIGPPYV